MIQLTKTQHRAITAFLEDRNRAEEGITEVCREAGVDNPADYDFNPILGQFRPKEVPSLQEVIEGSGGEIAGELDKIA